MAQNQNKVVFVTGASGFVGSAVVQQLLDAGYHVRGTARGEKANNLRKSFTSSKERFEVVEIADISKDDVGDALKGVYAVIHVALYSPGQGESIEDMINGTINGSLNVIKQAEQFGVKHIVVTGTMAAVASTLASSADGLIGGHDDWNPVTKEEAIKLNAPMAGYAAGKKYSELAIWEWAKKHPEVEVTVINPPVVHGPWPKEFHTPAPTFPSMTPAIWQLVKPSGSFLRYPQYVDVRDLAKAHILALSSPPSAQVGRKRLIITSPYGTDWDKAKQLLKEKRPELKDRIAQKEVPANIPKDPLGVDFGRITEVLGMKKEDFHTFEETILDTVDNYVSLHKQWIQDGHEVNIPDLLPGFAAE